jgi:hypothetical protein
MAVDRNATGTGEPGSPWPRYLQFLFVVFLTVMFFWLALSMKRHHFLDGSLDHRPHDSRQ